MGNRIILLFFAAAALFLVFFVSSALLLKHRARSGKSVRAVVWILLFLFCVIPLFLPRRFVSLRLFTDCREDLRIEVYERGGEGELLTGFTLPNRTVRAAVSASVLFLTLWTVAFSASFSFGLSGYWDTLRFLTRNSAECRDERVRELFLRVKRKAGIRRPVMLRVMHPDLKISPCMCGTWSPSVFIGESCLRDMPEESLELIFLHEMAHIRHHDGLLRLLTLFCTSFHALVSTSPGIRRAVEEDTEFLCDREVLALAGEEMRKAYIRTILTVAERTLSDEAPDVSLLSPVSEAGELLKKRWARMNAGGDRFAKRSLAAPAAALLINLILFNLMGTENPDDLRLDFADAGLADALVSHFALADVSDITQEKLTSVWSLEFYRPEDSSVYYCIVNETAPERTEAGEAHPLTEQAALLEDLALFRDLRTLILEGEGWNAGITESLRDCAVIVRD